MSLINGSKVKECLKGYSVSSDLYTELDNEVKFILDKAKKRAKSNNRSTIMGRDL